MNYRTEVITGNCTKKSDLVIIYKTLVKLTAKWDNNYYLMAKCSRMLSKANSKCPDLSSICDWFSKHLRIVLDVYEVRSLLRYVSIIENDKRSRALGYCDLYPPSKGEYDQWCSILLSLASEKVASAKEKESQTFHRNIESLSIQEQNLNKKKRSSNKKKKRKGKDNTNSSPISVEQGLIFPSVDQTKKLLSQNSSAKSLDTKAVTFRKRKNDNLSTAVLKRKDHFPNPQLHHQKSFDSHFENLTNAVVDTQVIKHAKRQIRRIPSLEQTSKIGSIDYNPVFVAKKSLESLEKGSTQRKAICFNDRIDEELFGEEYNDKIIVNKYGLLQEMKASRMVKERHKFKQESERVKNEVFAKLGL